MKLIDRAIRWLSPRIDLMFDEYEDIERVRDDLFVEHTTRMERLKQREDRFLRKSRGYDSLSQECDYHRTRANKITELLSKTKYGRGILVKLDIDNMR